VPLFGPVAVVVGIGTVEVGEEFPADVAEEFVPPPAPEQAPAAKAASGAMDNTKIRNFRVVIGLPVWEMWGGIFHKTASFARLGVRTVESAD